MVESPNTRRSVLGSIPAPNQPGPRTKEQHVAAQAPPSSPSTQSTGLTCKAIEQARLDVEKFPATSFSFSSPFLNSLPQSPPVFKFGSTSSSQADIFASLAQRSPMAISNAKSAKGISIAQASRSVRDSTESCPSSEVQKPNVSHEPSTASATSSSSAQPAHTPVTQPSFLFKSVSFNLTGQFLEKRDKGTGKNLSGRERDIKQAPLLSGNIIAEHAKDLIPQYGVLGCLAGESPLLPSSQIFQNTNTTFSAFICGVQGSGKSHTTAAMIENAVISSPYLGRLQTSASVLVFSYGKWGNDGAGFNISEATFLAASHADYPGHHAKKITVMVSPSNPGIARLYRRLPNVKVILFRLNQQTLNGDALNTLMCVDDKTTPLYMAKVEAILRAISSTSENGLNYKIFKSKLANEKFDATQRNMLDMRLNLLESFLDLQGNAVEPRFEPGKITIMDLSDPFISPSTACILFKIGMDRFLASPPENKMMMLDEAHKYMLNTPGSNYFTDCIDHNVRVIRHDGLRIIISTQEPTVSTDLIALCSITVIHRFTSPTWAMALKKHITAMDDRQTMMKEIEGLETGEAFVFAPGAVLGKDRESRLDKATGRLLKLEIRRRVTRDGGETIMAV